MRNFAFAYVEKYAPSKQQLKTYLLKKYLKTSVPNVKKQDVNKLIEIVLSDLEKSKFINDKFYSESKARSMIQRALPQQMPPMVQMKFLKTLKIHGSSVCS